MSETENLILEHLRAIRADVAEIKAVQREHGHRLTALELALARDSSREAVALANVRIDGIADRLTRIERRLDLVDEPPADH